MQAVEPIQDAIENASDGDMILVYSGKYYENVNVSKQLVLRGIDNGGGKPVVDGGGSGSAISLSSGNSTLEGFAAIRSSVYQSETEIIVTSNNNLLRNNTALNDDYGIYLYYSNNNTLLYSTENDRCFSCSHSCW